MDTDIELSKEDVEDFVRELTPNQAEILQVIITQCKIRYVKESIEDVYGIVKEYKTKEVIISNS